MTPCKDEADFQPSNTVFEHCEFAVQPDNASCARHTCRWEGVRCECRYQESCASMAGRWISTTCADHLSVQDAAWHEAVQSAHGNGSCSVDTLQRISWSRQCCKSYPANACNKVAKRTTPCRDEADFQPGKIRHNYCALFDQPENASCTRHGCRWNNARCDCSDQEGCVSLAGRWISHTCADYLSEQDAAWHKAVQLAHGNGSCSVDTLQRISWSQECCKSYPANACYKTLKRTHSLPVGEQV